MQGFVDNFLNNQYIPYGICYLRQQELIWLHALSDIVIALAFFAIPLTILFLINKRKKRLPFIWIFAMFATFIFLCGLTHLLNLIAIWHPVFYILGFVKLLTAAVSLATAVMMFPLVPVLLDRLEEVEKILLERDMN